MTTRVKSKLHGFGEGCPKCKAKSSVQTHCARCPEVRKVEHLHCACTQCGYAWVQETADAKNGGRQ